MIQAHKEIDFWSITIPLSEIAEGPIGTPVSDITLGRAELWATSRFHSIPKQPTLKKHFMSKVSGFDNGKTQNFLRIEVYLYPMSDTVAESALKDLEVYIKTGISPQAGEIKRLEAEKKKKK